MNVRQTAVSKELDRQALVNSVRLQRQTGPLRGCTVVRGVEIPPPPCLAVEQVGDGHVQRRRYVVDLATSVAL